MPKSKQRKRTQQQRRPRKLLNLGVRTVTFYVVRFMVKVPDEMRENTDAPEWMSRESPPTLDEAEAWGAYDTTVAELMAQHSGVRSPQLIRRTVTEDILRDYDHDHTASDDDGQDDAGVDVDDCIEVAAP